SDETELDQMVELGRQRRTRSADDTCDVGGRHGLELLDRAEDGVLAGAEPALLDRLLDQTPDRLPCEEELQEEVRLEESVLTGLAGHGKLVRIQTTFRRLYRPARPARALLAVAVMVPLGACGASAQSASTAYWGGRYTLPLKTQPVAL